MSCFWCGAKGHTLIDCTDPAPNPASKLARDNMIAVREKRDQTTRNADRKARRLASANTAAASAQVNDNEGDDGSEYDEGIHAAFLALFHGHPEKKAILFP